METESSLPYSQEPANCPYPEQRHELKASLNNLKNVYSQYHLFFAVEAGWT
jgi:hypothetical protein